jgi:hypothetical protein
MPEPLSFSTIQGILWYLAEDEIEDFRLVCNRNKALFGNPDGNEAAKRLRKRVRQFRQDTRQ